MSDTSLQLLELMLNLLTLLLFLVELVLEFTRHTVVTILSLLQVESDLMHVGKSVEILVLVKKLVLALLTEGVG